LFQDEEIAKYILQVFLSINGQMDAAGPSGRHQIGVDLVRVGRGHTVRKARVGFQYVIPQQFCDSGAESA
jgi:hypothetical protein